MKIHSIVPSNSKMKLRLQTNCSKNRMTQKQLVKQRSFLRIHVRKSSKQNRQKCIYRLFFQLKSHEKFQTFASLPKNRKNSLPQSNSSLQKKLYHENIQKLEQLVSNKPIRSFTKSSEVTLDSTLANQLVQNLLLTSLAQQRQNRQVFIQKKDLISIFSLLLNSEAQFPDNKRFLSFYQTLKDLRGDSSRKKVQKNNKKKLNNLKIEPVLKLTYLPLSKGNQSLAIENKVVQFANKHKQNVERSSHQYQIRRLRDSLLSQQNLVTNIKNGRRFKHCSRQEDRLQIPTHVSRPQNNPALDYVLQQNQLLMKVACQEFKKYESQIYEYGLLLQSKHLEIDLEYQEFLANSEQDSTVRTMEEMLRSIILDSAQSDCHKYNQLSNSFRVFIDKMRLRDSKLKKLVEIKSTFISQFSSKMQFWIESLAFKKEFTQNLANYIQKQSDYSQEAIGMLSRVIQERNYSGMLGKVEQLRTSLEVFFENLLNSHQFS